MLLLYQCTCSMYMLSVRFSSFSMVVVTSGHPDVVIPDDRTCTEWLFDQVKDLTDHTALINAETGERFSYATLRQLVVNVSSSLRRHGLQKEDVLCVYAGNSPEMAILTLAALREQVIVTLVNPDYTPDELRRQLEDSGTTYVYTQLELLKKVKATGAAYKKIKTIFTLHDAPGSVSFKSLCKGAQVLEDQEERRIEARTTVALLPYSSGTTGLPKGVMLSHYNIIANLIQISHPSYQLARREGDVLVGFAPFFHVAGMIMNLLHSLAGKSTLVVMSKFDYHTYLGLLGKYRASLILLSPPVLVRMAKDMDLHRYDLSSVRCVAVGSAPTPPETNKQLVQKLGITDIGQGWGMTETTCVGSIPSILRPTKLASIGHVIVNTEVKVVDPSTLEELVLGQTGELWIRGPQVMIGYWRRPKQTRDTITEDGWLRTGDLAYIDEDHFIFIVDRLKELIKVKGFQVAPAELEAELLTHPGIVDAAVVGVEDSRSGQLPQAYVVLREGARVTAEDVQAYIKDRVAPYKQLKGGVVFVKEIPKSKSGKILRRLIKRQSKSFQSKL